MTQLNNAKVFLQVKVKRGELIYADLGSVPLPSKRPIPPPPIEKVVYSDAREFMKPKVSFL